MARKQDTDTSTAAVGAIGMLLMLVVGTYQFFKLIFTGKSSDEQKKTAKVLGIVLLVCTLIFTAFAIYTTFFYKEEKSIRDTCDLETNQLVHIAPGRWECNPR